MFGFGLYSGFGVVGGFCFVLCSGGGGFGFKMP